MMFFEHQAIPFLDSLRSVEPLFALIMMVSSLFSDNSFFFVALFSIIQGFILLKLIRTSKRPAIFLLIYVSVYYCEFEFNILRAGTAVMLLVLASRYIGRSEKGPFYACCVAAVLMHYSAITGLLILVFIEEKEWKKKLLLIVIATAAALLIFYFLMNESRLGKLLFYFNAFAKDDSANYGLGFYIIQLLYLLYYISTVKRESFFSQSFLLIIWLTVTWASLSFGFIDRLKIIFGALYLFQGVEIDLTGLRRKVRAVAVSGIAAVSLFGNLKTMERISFSTDLGFNASISPFIPYKFFWDK